MFPMVTDVEDWDAAMHIVEHCRQSCGSGRALQRKDPWRHAQRAVGLPDRDESRGPRVRFSGHRHQRPDPVHPRRRPELASAERYYRPASPAMKKLIAMVMEMARPATCW